MLRRAFLARLAGGVVALPALPLLAQRAAEKAPGVVRRAQQMAARFGSRVDFVRNDQGRVSVLVDSVEMGRLPGRVTAQHLDAIRQMIIGRHEVPGGTGRVSPSIQQIGDALVYLR